MRVHEQALPDGGDGFGPHVKTAEVLPNGRAASAPVVEVAKVTEADVTPEDKKYVLTSYLQIWKIRKEEAGVEERLEAVRGRLGEHVVDIARRAIELSLVEGKDGEPIPNYPQAVEYYGMLTGIGEAYIQAKDKDARVKAEEIGKDGALRAISAIIPTYAPYKSQTLRSLKAGFDPDEKNPPMEGEDEGASRFPDAAAYRKASAPQTRAPRQTTAGGKPGVVSGISTAKDLSANFGFSQGISAVMTAVLMDLRRLTPEAADKHALPVLKTFAAQVHTLVEKVVASGNAGASASATTGDPAADKAAGERIATENAEAAAAAESANGKRKGGKGKSANRAEAV